MNKNLPKIAICLTTIGKDDIFMDVVRSILDIYQENWVILIADQNLSENDSFEKKSFYLTACADAHKLLNQDERIHVIRVPYNSGLSYSRNELVQLADQLGINFCLVGADSIKFTKDLEKINYLYKYLNYSKEFNIDLLGFDLLERIGWEAYLYLEDSFILDFIDKCTINALLDRYLENSFTIWHCDIVRNFFLATTKSLLKVKWDNNLIMQEHEDFFWRYKKEEYKVGWTDYVKGEYIKCNDINYRQLRSKNMHNGQEYLLKKYGLKSWVTYKHLERTKKHG